MIERKCKAGAGAKGKEKRKIERPSPPQNKPLSSRMPRGHLLLSAPRPLNFRLLSITRTEDVSSDSLSYSLWKSSKVFYVKSLKLVIPEPSRHHFKSLVRLVIRNLSEHVKTTPCTYPRTKLTICPAPKMVKNVRSPLLLTRPDGL